MNGLNGKGFNKGNRKGCSMEGVVFNIQKFCVNDGPGIRTTVFLRGCPLRCLWCHNPESQEAGVSEGSGTPGDGALKGGASEGGRWMDSGEVLAEVMKDRLFYESSGGGLTLSGGEPLFQFSFALALLREAKEKGIHTALETCGYAAEDRIRRIAGYTDLFLYDCKETDPGRHKSCTGVDNILILNNLRVLNEMNKKVILRCPVIPGYNDRPDHFAGIADLANRYGNIRRIELEPYHSLGENKYVSLGRTPVRIQVPGEEKKNSWLAQVRGLTDKEVIFA